MDEELQARLEQRKRRNPAPAGRRYYTEVQRNAAFGLNTTDRSADSTISSINNTTQETISTPNRSADRKEIIRRRQELTRMTREAMGGDFNQFKMKVPRFDPQVSIEHTDDSEEDETSTAGSLKMSYQNVTASFPEVSPVLDQGSLLQDEDGPPPKKSRNFREPSPLEQNSGPNQMMDNVPEDDTALDTSQDEPSSNAIRSGRRPNRENAEPSSDEEDDDAFSDFRSSSRREDEIFADEFFRRNSSSEGTPVRARSLLPEDDSPSTKKARPHLELSPQQDFGLCQILADLPGVDYEDEAAIGDEGAIRSGRRPNRAVRRADNDDDLLALHVHEDDVDAPDPIVPPGQHRFGRRNLGNGVIDNGLAPYAGRPNKKRKAKKQDQADASMFEEVDEEHIVMVLKKPNIQVPDSPQAGVRRSRRTRIAPVRRWLGEEPVYENSPGGSRTMTDVSRVVIRDPLFLKTKSSDIVKANNRARRGR